MQIKNIVIIAISLVTTFNNLPIRQLHINDNDTMAIL